MENCWKVEKVEIDLGNVSWDFVETWVGMGVRSFPFKSSRKQRNSKRPKKTQILGSWLLSQNFPNQNFFPFYKKSGEGSKILYNFQKNPPTSQSQKLPKKLQCKTIETI